MATQNQFVTFTPYDEQMAEIQRRQRMADLMQQQAQAPLETPQSGGRMIARVSPVAGLAKMLQAYMGGKEQRAIGEQQKELGRQDIQNAMSLMDRLQAGKPSEMSSDQALAASMSTQPTAQAPNQPFSNVEQRQFLATQGMLGGPRTQALAAALMPKPETPEYYDAVPVTVNGVTKMVQYSKGVGAPRILEGQKFEKPSAPHTATIMKNGKRMVVDVVTGQEVGEAPAEYRAPEPLVAIVDATGKPQYVSRSQAIGQKPYMPATIKQELVEADREKANRQAEISTQDTLDNAAALLQHPGRKSGTGASSWMGNVPGTGAKDFQASLNTFKAQTFIPMVSALRGMGALSDAEGKKLSESVGALDPSMSESAFEESLRHVIKLLADKAKASGLQVKNPLNTEQQPTMPTKPSGRAASYLPPQ